MNAEDLEQIEAIKIWAKKKMDRIEKRLERYAKVYYGKPMKVLYIEKKVDDDKCE